MSSTRMPALFLGHGSPMNVLEDNVYTRAWQQLGETLPRPKAIVVVSAHWFTRGTGVTAMEAPKTIHDFGGFPQALYDPHYPAPGSPELAQHLVDLLAPVSVALDKEAWGFDHGSWGVLIKMYPNADIPMVQLSIDSTKPAAWHFEMGANWRHCVMRVLCWWPVVTWCITYVLRVGTVRTRHIRGQPHSMIMLRLT